MKISPISNLQYNTTFNARIESNTVWDNYLRDIDEFAPYKKGVYNTVRDKRFCKENPVD